MLFVFLALQSIVVVFFTARQWPLASSCSRFLDHTQRCATVGRTPLDVLSIHRRDLYLKIHNTHNRQTSMPPVGFEPTISTGERPQTYALDSAATGTGYVEYIPDEACEVCRVGSGCILNVCPEPLFRGSAVSVLIPLICKTL